MFEILLSKHYIKLKRRDRLHCSSNGILRVYILLFSVHFIIKDVGCLIYKTT